MISSSLGISRALCSEAKDWRWLLSPSGDRMAAVPALLQTGRPDPFRRKGAGRSKEEGSVLGGLSIGTLLKND
jgi:hypothetical protein